MYKKEIKKIKNFVKKNKILVITGKNSYTKSGSKKLFNFTTSENLKIYFKKSYLPELKESKSIISLIKKFNPKKILLIGGGSVMDLGKISNFLWDKSDLKTSVIESSYKKGKRFAELIAVPTTAGSGAEVTSNAVLYINKKKYSVENKLIKPNKFLLVPELIKKNSNKIKSSAGFDSIAQAVESLVSVNSTSKSLEYSISSLRYSLKNYLTYLKKPNSVNSINMLKAANYSGKAINLTKTTAPHAVSYPFTAHYGISHGHAVALTFTDFMKFNFENIKKSHTKFSLEGRMKILFKLTETQNLIELLKYFEYLKKEARLEDNFKKLNIDIYRNFRKIIRDVNLSRLSNNPVKVDFQTIKEILLKK